MSQLSTPITESSSAEPENRGWYSVAWLVGLAHLLVLLGLLAWRPLHWFWLGWIDLAAACVMMFATLLGATLPHVVPNTVSIKKRYVLVFALGLPGLAWLGLLGHQSIVAQLTWLIILCGMSWLAVRQPSEAWDHLIARVLSMVGSDRVSHPPLSASRPNQVAISDVTAQNEKDTTQTWKRTSTPSGDVIHGSTTVCLEADQKTAWVHIPIWPAFSSADSMTFEGTASEPRATARATQLTPHGIRVEIKRSGRPLPEETLRLQFTIRQADGEGSA